ncbi:MAG: hypothetical protein JNK43_04860 [Ignavibacteria bacterium]|nr:hypothetical protein [Ignavibacteria bacterium]
MAKGFIVILFIILSILLGCGQKSGVPGSDVKPDLDDSTRLRSDVKNTLSEIEETYSSLDYDKVISEHSKIIPQGMSVTKFRYFVVFSELDEELTYRLIDTDMRNTIDHMSGNFTRKLPTIVTPIYLFEDFDRYKEFVLKNYDIAENDISPYGFFKISKNVIVVRYVSWKGSILHEITHRFTKSDFPEMPSWFDEGFASLNEKSTFKDGKLIGEFSYRIIPLRRAIENNTYTSIEHLMKTDDEELYGKRTSFYYAQSRYLLMYLQEKGLLETFYKTFRDSYSEDKTGISQLESLFNKPISSIDEDCLEYIKSFKQQ